MLTGIHSISLCWTRPSILSINEKMRRSNPKEQSWKTKQGHKTQSHLVVSFESQSWVKVKVVVVSEKVKWAWYIYHKQCEILQKIHWNSSNGQFQWFPIDFSGNGPKSTKTMQTQTLFSQIGNFFWGIQGMPSESWRPGLSENVVVERPIMCYIFENAWVSRILNMAYRC